MRRRNFYVLQTLWTTDRRQRGRLPELRCAAEQRLAHQRHRQHRLGHSGLLHPDCGPGAVFGLEGHQAPQRQGGGHRRAGVGHPERAVLCLYLHRIDQLRPFGVGWPPGFTVGCPSSSAVTAAPTARSFIRESSSLSARGVRGSWWGCCCRRSG